jgi:hypothetical protein
MPDDGESVVFPGPKPNQHRPNQPQPNQPQPNQPQPNQPQPNQPQQNQPQQNQPQPRGGPAGAADADAPAAPKQRKGVLNTNGLDVHDDDIPATQRVVELCRRLSFVPPRYILMPDESTNSYWSGGPAWGSDQMNFPPDVGKIEHILGKKFAREKIAEDVLTHLLQVQAQRKAELDQVMKTPAPA